MGQIPLEVGVMELHEKGKLSGPLISGPQVSVRSSTDLAQFAKFRGAFFEKVFSSVFANKKLSQKFS